MKTVTGGILRETIRCGEGKQKKGTENGSLIKKLAATYFSTNKCSIIGDVRLLPGSGTYSSWLLPLKLLALVAYSNFQDFSYTLLLCSVRYCFYQSEN